MSHRPRPDLSRNALLARMGLSPADLDVAEVERGQVLWEDGDPIERVAFPLSGMVSLVVMAPDGRGVEAATVGREGAVGATPGLGPIRAFARAVVQLPGVMAQVGLARLHEMALGDEAVRDALDRWREALLRQVMQGAACNALHETPERAARWIAMTRDRCDEDELPLTQEFLAEMLGVNRPTVSLAAQDLAARGLVEYRRGTIRVLDRARLEAASCPCLHASRAAYDDLLGSTGSGRS